MDSAYKRGRKDCLFGAFPNPAFVPPGSCSLCTYLSLPPLPSAPFTAAPEAKEPRRGRGKDDGPKARSGRRPPSGAIAPSSRFFPPLSLVIFREVAVMLHELFHSSRTSG